MSGTLRELGEQDPPCLPALPHLYIAVSCDVSKCVREHTLLKILKKELVHH